MGMLGLMFEPQPPNFENLYNFLRCSNDVKMIPVAVLGLNSDHYRNSS